MSDPMPDAIPPEWTGLQIAEEDDSDWEVNSVPSDEESPVPSESDSGSDEESRDEVSNKRRRQSTVVSRSWD